MSRRLPLIPLILLCFLSTAWSASAPEEPETDDEATCIVMRKGDRLELQGRVVLKGSEPLPRTTLETLSGNMYYLVGDLADELRDTRRRELLVIRAVVVFPGADSLPPELEVLSYREPD